MDRHDIPGVSASHVAEAHQNDLEIQHKYECRVVTYWYEEKRGTAFCLIDAPDKNAVEKMHDDSHGLIPKKIIEVEGNVVEAFLGRMENPETHDDSGLFDLIDPAFRTVMVTELKDAALMKSIS